MILYRLCAKRYATTAWSGIGSLKSTTARWNKPGTAMVYTSASLSLAMLEVLVHLNDESILKNFMFMSIDVADDYIAAVDVSTLPIGWNNATSRQETKEIGSDWYEEGGSVGLMVPSVIVPIEYNVLINSTHPDFASCIGTVKEVDISLDERLGVKK